MARLEPYVLISYQYSLDTAVEYLLYTDTSIIDEEEEKWRKNEVALKHNPSDTSCSHRRNMDTTYSIYNIHIYI